MVISQRAYLLSSSCVVLVRDHPREKTSHNIDGSVPVLTRLRLRSVTADVLIGPANGLGQSFSQPSCGGSFLRVTIHADAAVTHKHVSPNLSCRKLNRGSDPGNRFTASA